jgi:transcriptional regulator with XRE-family HTH domain
MSDKPINDVLAENLAYFMGQQSLTQQALGNKCGMAQTTVGLYLHPTRRKISASGKAPSAKLSEVEQLSKILGVEIWQLLRPLDPDERSAYEAIEAAFRLLHPKPNKPTLIASTKTPKAGNHGNS